MEIIAETTGDEAASFMDLVAPHLGTWGAPVIAAILGAAASTTISHFLTKRRDAAAEKRQEARDVRTAERHARELENQRREAAAEQAKRDRIAAVKSYHDAYRQAIRPDQKNFPSDRTQAARNVTREFALEIKPHSPASAKLVRDIVTVIDKRGHNFEDALRALDVQRTKVFEDLMSWAITDNKQAIRDAFRHVAQHYTSSRESQAGLR